MPVKLNKSKLVTWVISTEGLKFIENIRNTNYVHIHFLYTLQRLL